MFGRSRGNHGPSPRVRGKPRRLDHVVRGPGSIPASAGETLPPSGALGALPVHPRECGGNWVFSLHGERAEGPSPRVRGKRVRRCPGRVQYGSIPASAGETRTAAHAADSRGVHPRECGGNATRFPRDFGADGPSPRVRGKRGGQRLRPGDARSIPASAGETSGSGVGATRPAVHPRECGGNQSRSCPGSAQPGPSPRVRGKRVSMMSSKLWPGSIPASAGET